MKAKDLRSKTAAELTTELEANLKAQFGLRMQKATAQLAKTTEIARVRKDIARIKTVMNEKARNAS
jgi:large subunit ribosomal protein L29